MPVHWKQTAGDSKRRKTEGGRGSVSASFGSGSKHEKNPFEQTPTYAIYFYFILFTTSILNWTNSVHSPCICYYYYSINQLWFYYYSYCYYNFTNNYYNLKFLRSIMNDVLPGFIHPFIHWTFHPFTAFLESRLIDLLRNVLQFNSGKERESNLQVPSYSNQQ